MAREDDREAQIKEVIDAFTFLMKEPKNFAEKAAYG